MQNYDAIEILTPEQSEQYSEESIINQFADAMADAGEGAFFRVELKERVGANGKPIAYNDHCGRYYLSELAHFMDLVERIQSEYGHGKYLFTLYGGGQRGIIKKQVVCIAKSNDTDAPKNQLQTAQSGNDLKELIANMLQAQQQQMQQFLQAMQPQQSRKEYFEELLMLKQFFVSDEKPSGRAGNPVKETLEMLALMKDGGLMGNEEEQDGFSRLIDKAGPIFAAALQSAPGSNAAANMQNQQMRKRKPRPTPTPTPKKTTLANKNHTKITTNNSTADNEMIEVFLKHKINSLVNAAADKKDPYIFAESLCNEFGAAVALEYAAKPDSLAKICSINPRAANFESWFLDLAEYIKAICGESSKFDDEFNEEFSDDETVSIADNTERSSGHARDVETNETNSEPMENDKINPGVSDKINEAIK